MPYRFKHKWIDDPMLKACILETVGSCQCGAGGKVRRICPDLERAKNVGQMKLFHEQAAEHKLSTTHVCSC